MVDGIDALFKPKNHAYPPTRCYKYAFWLYQEMSVTTMTTYFSTSSVASKNLSNTIHIRQVSSDAQAHHVLIVHRTSQ